MIDRREERRLCMGLVVFAVLVRLVMAVSAAPAARNAAQTTDVLVLQILAAETPSAPEPEPEAIPEPEPEPEADAPVRVPVTFSPEEADGVEIAGACSYTPDKRALLMQPPALDFEQDGPTVLIVHTHSSEAYTMETGWEYTESDEMRTQDETYSVVRVGSEIAEALTAASISVLHDTRPNDYPNYNGAYERMRLTIEEYLAQYPSIQMVLDIHRDAASDADGNPVSLTADVDGEDCAALMLVVGTDEGGLTHPDWADNLSLAIQLQALLNRRAPGLCRPIDLRTERFNQHETHGSLLVEFGANGNTLAEAIRSARVFSEALIAWILGE